METTAATSYDGAAVEAIHAALEAKGLLPDEHIVDSGYLGAEVLASAERNQGMTLLGPVPEESSWQARSEQAFDLAQFHIDWQKQQVTCPEGKSSRHWIQTYNRHGKEVIHAKFSPTDCRGCPSHACCTRAKAGARMLSFHTDPLQHQSLQQARLRQKAPDFKAKYAKRAGIEGTISQGVRGFDLRHARYKG
jgi:transposase